MNALRHKLVFSKKHSALVAVGENATANGKSSSGESTSSQPAPGEAGAGGEPGRAAVSAQGSFVTCLYKAFLGVGLIGMSGLHMGAAHAQLASNSLPTGGVVSSGSASIAATGSTMKISQASDRASINWNSFNVGSAASVNIVQPGASSVLLNRVVGSNPSQIMGSIRANGQVMLVNPNGVVFGKGGSVTATSFTASTLGISDADFQAGNHRFTRNGSTAGVVNEGTITTTGGYVALLGASVTNDGKIVSNGGDVALGAGQSADIGVPVSRGGKVRLLLSAADINTAVANNANGIIQTDGGQVLMQAASVGQALASINQSGRIDTSGAQGGAVTLRADHGKITVNGSVVANSTDAANKAGGSIVIGRADDENGKLLLASLADVSGAQLESKGGFVETSGAWLKTDGVSVKAKDWLLDPYDVEISDAATPTAGYSQVKASVINAALNNGTNVTVETTAPIATGVTPASTGTSSGIGNILVNSNISKTGGADDATLTLTADNGIIVNNSITANAAGIGKLNVVMTANGNATIASNNGGIFLRNPIDINGSITLNGINKGSTVNITQHGVRTAGITARSIDIKGYSTRSAGSSGIGVRIAGDLIATGGDINVYGEGATQWGVYGAGNGASGVSTGTIYAKYEATGKVNFGGATTGGNMTGVTLIDVNVKGQDININADPVATAAANANTALNKAVLRNNVAIYNTSSAYTNTFTTTGTSGVAGDTGTTTIVGSITTGLNTVNSGSNGIGVNISNNFTTNGALKVTGTSADTYSFALLTNGTVTAKSMDFKGYGTGYSPTGGTNPTASGIGTRIAGSLITTGGDIKLYGEGVSQEGVYVGGILNTGYTGKVDISGLTANSTGYAVRLYSSTVTATTVDIRPDLVDNSKAIIKGTLRNNASTQALNTFNTTGATGTTIHGLVANGVSGTAVGTEAIVSNGALNIKGTATSNSDAVSLGSTITGNGSGKAITIEGIGAGGQGVVVNNVIRQNDGADIVVTGTAVAGRGVLIQGSANFLTTGTTRVTGTSNDHFGVRVITNNGVVGIGNMEFEGTTSSTVGFSGVGVFGIASGSGLSSSGGNVSVLGTSKGTGTGVTLDGGRVISATGTGNSVLIQGTATAAAATQAVVLNGTVSSASGSITATAISKDSAAAARLEINAGTLLSAGTINLNADALQVSATSSINATGTGTVNISTQSADAKIDVGNTTGNVGSTTTANRTLGVSNALAGRITAGTLNISSADKGDITVSGAFTGANSSGAGYNVKLQTAGTIAVNAALQAGSNASLKNLTLNATGSVSTTGMDSTITGVSGSVKAAGLELLGSNATVSLTNAANSATTVAANVKALSLTNSAATMTVGTVNNTGGIKTNGITTLNTGSATATVNQGTAVGEAISAAGGLQLLGANGTYNLTNDNNSTGTIAANVKSLSYTNAGALSVGTVNGTVGIDTSAQNGAVSLTTKAGNVTLNNAINAGSGAVTLNAVAGSVVRDAALAVNSISGGILRINAGNGIGTGTSATDRLTTSVDSMVLTSSGSQYVLEANAVTVAGSSTGGNIDIQTTNGTLTVGSGTSVAGTTTNGLTAGGTGDVTLLGNSSTGDGLNIFNDVTSTGGSAYLTGTSSVANGIDIRNNVTATAGDVILRGTNSSTVESSAGIRAAQMNGKTVSAKNITIDGKATDTNASSKVLGFYGGAGTYAATDTLTLIGSTTNTNAGFYAFKGNYTAVNGISVTGSSGFGGAIGLDAGVVISNSGTGNISMTGNAADSTRGAISLSGANITNSATNGSVVLTAESGHITSDGGNPAWSGYPVGGFTNSITNGATGGSGKVELLAGNGNKNSTGRIDAGLLNITQNADGGVTLLTSGSGNVVVGGLENKGNGAVELVAGSKMLAGESAGTVSLYTPSSGTVTRSNQGTLKVVTGSYESFGAISAWNSLTSGGNGFNNLYYNAVSANKNNVGFNKAYGDAMNNNNGDTNQVQFRQNKVLTFTAELNTTPSTTYGDVVHSADQGVLLARLTAENTGGSKALADMTVDGGSGNTFRLSASDVMDNLSGTRAVGTRSQGGFEYANEAGYAYTLGTGGRVENLVFRDKVTKGSLVHVINRASASASAIRSVPIYNGGTQTQAITTTGLKAGDDVTINGMASGRNVGTYTSALTVGGADAVNYIAALTNDTMTIAPAPLTVRAVATTKLFDGNNSSTGTPTVIGLQGGDTFSTSQTYDNANLGSGKTLTATAAVAEDENGGANYTVSYEANTNGVITTANNLPIVNPNLPAGGTSSKVNLGVGSGFALAGVDECSAGNLENCVCEDVTNPGAEVANNQPVAVCTPLATNKDKEKGKDPAQQPVAALTQKKV